MNKKINNVIFGVLVILILGLTSVWAAEDPFGIQTITPINSSRPDTANYPAASVQAEAGNVTEINLTATSTTKAWQGYFGDITGTITLENSDQEVFYNWTSNEPKGEIYAANISTVNWSAMNCFLFNGSNQTSTGGDAVNVSILEQEWGIQRYDEDGINETFTEETGLNFSIGTHQFGLNDCVATNPFMSDNGTDFQNNHDEFENILLWDNSSRVPVFMTIIENDDGTNVTDVKGFDNRTHDFQLLVLEDGHDNQEDITTTFYFYAEIE